MRRVFVVLAAVVLAMPVLRAQATKTANGKVTAVGANSVTINAGDKDMTFSVDAKTKVVKTGGSHASAAAKAEGKAGPAISAMLKVGDDVEVTYHDMGGTMHAAMITEKEGVKPGEVAQKAPKPPTMTTRGTVSSVAQDSLTISVKGKDMTFSVDKSTYVQAKGASTMTSKKKAEGAPGPTIADLVHTGDSVTVLYHDMAGSMHATEVRVTAQAKKK